jgi:UTP:GlnB (protein PII) uridylyltransferase
VKGPKSLQSTPQWRALQEEFLATGEAAAIEKALTMARDESVVEAYRAAMEPAFPQGVAILAGGAYGRGQTFPYSELDIVLLLDSEKQSEALKEMLPEFVRLLWNAGLRLNSAVLTIAECLEAVERASVAAFTLLDRRLLAGDGAVSEKLDVRFPPALALHRECAPCGAPEHAGPCRARRERGPRRIAGRAAGGLAIAAPGGQGRA